MIYDVIVIGCGPAGLSAAVNVRQRGGSVLIIGTPSDTSPLAKAERIDNYPGLPGLSGMDFLEKLTEHAKAMGADFKRERVLNAMYYDGTWMVSAGSDVEQAYALVFAGGITRGKPYPGEEEYLGRGVSYCATCDGMLYRGKKVAVIGFGDSAREEAEYLEKIGCLTDYYQKPGEVRINGERTVLSVTIDGVEHEVSCVFILRPSLAPAKIFPELNQEDGYVAVDRQMKTNLPALFAAGDCTGQPLQAAKAAGEGLIAGQSAMKCAVAAKKAKEA